MVFASKTMGLALLSLAARRAMAVEVGTCAELITEVGAISGSGTIEVTADIECSEDFSIAAAQDVTITGPATITIGADFTPSTAESTGGGSLIVNQGTLELNGLTFETLDTTTGNRAILNEGTLTVVECSFELFQSGGFISEGGAIYSDSTSSVELDRCNFKSNIASERGGALLAAGSETLTIIESTFQSNEVGVAGDASSGGDVWASRDVDLTIEGSAFSGGSASGSGGSLVFCGGSISNSNFTGVDSSSDSTHFGAVLVGGPNEDACPRTLAISNSVFYGNSAVPQFGAGAALAIFDTSAEITDTTFWGNRGTAVLFQSSSATGEHQLEVWGIQFNENTYPSEAYSAEAQQGAAIVVTNTAGGDDVDMGSFTDTYCFANEPYECEIVYDGASFLEEGEFKCHICNIDGVRQGTDVDDDFEGYAININSYTFDFSCPVAAIIINSDPIYPEHRYIFTRD